MKVKVYVSTDDPFVFKELKEFEVESDKQREKLEELLRRVHLE